MVGSDIRMVWGSDHVARAFGCARASLAGVGLLQPSIIIPAHIEFVLKLLPFLHGRN